MVKRKTIPAWKILKVFRRDKFTCQYCGAKGIDLEIDHVIPIALGGSNSEVNLVTACRRCNRKKGKKKADEFRTTVAYLRGEEEKPLSYFVGTGSTDEKILDNSLIKNNDSVQTKEKTSKEENVNIASITLSNGQRVEAPATPEGFAFLERALAMSLRISYPEKNS